MKPGGEVYPDNLNIVLAGITGSRAYGLEQEDSDWDIKGVYIDPTDKVLSMGYDRSKATVDHTNPDYCYHEIEKFMRLAMSVNPTITELLWLEDYTALNEWGKLLVYNRELFLSNVIFKSYGGYALDQARDLNRRGDTYGHGKANRYEKHSRHTWRLLIQGRELLETGKLTVRVTPKVREELFAIGKLPPNELVDKFTEDFKEFDKIKSVLPDKPDKKKINDLLLQIRKAH